MVVRLHNSSLDDDNNDKRPFLPPFLLPLLHGRLGSRDGENERLVKMKGDGGERSGQEQSGMEGLVTQMECGPDPEV